MLQEYNHSYISVNNLSCFTANKFACITTTMNFGERLKMARRHKALSQAALAEIVKISQANISKLEIGEANGSEYVVQLAIACGVNPEWLATGAGNMNIPDFQYENSPEAQLFKAMQNMDAATKYQLVKIGNSLAEPTEKPNGTEK
jgi:transcriptional regulator with XRE-family HTH domain